MKKLRYNRNRVHLIFQRLNIIKGGYEPTDAEAKCAFDPPEVKIAFV